MPAPSSISRRGCRLAGKVPATYSARSKFLAKRLHRPHTTSCAASADAVAELNQSAEAKRMEQLVQQACDALDTAATFQAPVFPCALIAGDVVILHLLHKQGLFDKVKVVFVDTLHLFPETLDFLKEVEERYGFKAEIFTPKDFPTVEEYTAVHGVDLPIRDTELYDKICKVEPFQRALAETGCDIMINGRRRDHGAERAHLGLFDVAKNGVCNCQPLAWWEFADCFAYAEHEGFELHPLHEKGFPSIGDVHSTVPIAREQWFEYGKERSGRFQGLTNSDGSSKTECGIHTVAEAPSSSLQSEIRSEIPRKQ
eukprot:jgi/Ulvmu1/10379/UM061_0063.1